MSSMITLLSSDAHTFEVPEEVAKEAGTIRSMLEDMDSSTDAIPIANVNGAILARVLQYAKYHVDAAKKNADDDDKPAKSAEEVAAWDAEFVDVDHATLFDIILAANYLNMGALLQLTCQTVARMIKGKSPEEIRTILNIKNDFTPEEEEQVRQENQWAFD